MNPYHQGQLDYFCAIYSVINALRLTHGINLAESRDILNTALREISSHSLLWDALLENHTDHHWVVHYMLGRFCGTGNRRLRLARLPLSYAQLAAQPANAGDNTRGKGSAFTPEELCARLEFTVAEPVPLKDLGKNDLHQAGVELGRTAAPTFNAAGARRGWSMEKLWPVLQYWLPTRGLLSAFGNVRKQNRCLLLRFHRFLPHQQFPLISHWSTGREFGKDTLMLYDCTANKDAVHSLPFPDCGLYPEQIRAGKSLALEPESVFFLEKF